MGTQVIEVGTRVAFSRDFLRNTGQIVGLKAYLRGLVLELAGDPLVLVKWDGWNNVQTINRNNLVREDRLHLEPA